jgi:LCCL domain
MKRCPQCGQTYNDGSLNFCLMDGVALVDNANSDATVILGGTEGSVPTVPAAGFGTLPNRTPVPQTGPVDVGGGGRQQKGGRLILWVGLVVLVIFLGVGSLVGLMLYNSSRGEKVRVNLPGNLDSPSPKRSSTPRVSPSPVTPREDATPDEDVPFAKDENEPADKSDEITPITWTTAAVGFKNEIGRMYSFECSAGGTSSAVWGSDIYTADSSICTAAVHAGKITFEDGGVVTIEYRPGRQIYGSTARNGVTSNTFGEYPKSFVFK